jgi:hypothetical protein
MCIGMDVALDLIRACHSFKTSPPSVHDGFANLFGEPFVFRKTKFAAEDESVQVWANASLRTR